MTANQHKERGRPRPRQRAVLDLVAEEEVAAPDRPEMGNYEKKRTRLREKKETTTRKKGNAAIVYDRFCFIFFLIVLINSLPKKKPPKVW